MYDMNGFDPCELLSPAPGTTVIEGRTFTAEDQPYLDSLGEDGPLWFVRCRFHGCNLKKTRNVTVCREIIVLTSPELFGWSREELMQHPDRITVNGTVAGGDDPDATEVERFISGPGVRANVWPSYVVATDHLRSVR